MKSNKNIPANKVVVMGLSGGMDSATLLGLLLSNGNTVHCCSFTYGSKHNKYENQASKNLVRYYKNQDEFNIKLHEFDISSIMKDFNSALLSSSDQDIPEGHYASESMKRTVVPGRNLIFSSIMAGLAESLGASYIALGVHSGDHHIYPDCRKEFIKSLDNTIFLSSDNTVEVLSPFDDLDKLGILRTGYSLPIPIPYHLTRTCYKDQLNSCGKCGSCVERLEAFELLNVRDPITYE